MNNLIAEWLPVFKRQSRFFGWLAGLFCAIFALDFLSRIYVARDAEARKFSAPVVSALPTDLASAVIKTRLATALPEVRPAEELEAPKQREVTLQGIFTSRGQRTAVLVLQAQGNLPIERRNVRVGDEVDGWIVETIDGTRIRFRKEAEVREHIIFRGKVD